MDDRTGCLSMGDQHPVKTAFRADVNALISQDRPDLPSLQRRKVGLVAVDQDELVLLLAEEVQHMAMAALAAIETITVTSELAVASAAVKSIPRSEAPPAAENLRCQRWLHQGSAKRSGSSGDVSRPRPLVRGPSLFYGDEQRCCLSVGLLLTAQILLGSLDLPLAVGAELLQLLLLFQGN